jgi:predicted tellurium resistance membrane protein TerC
MHLLLDPAAWASLISLTALEIVLGVDNIVVLSILTQRLPPAEAKRARAVGLALALALRLLLLSAISWITRLTYPVFTAVGQDFSWRDAILIGGGLFLMVKATQEIHAEIEGGDDAADAPKTKAKFGAVITQIAIMDLVFSLDSIITAVGLAREIEIMATAIIIAIGVMYVAAGPVSGFIKRHPTTKMLGLCFLILIGVALVADGFGMHLPRGYIYFAMAFAALVEAFNVWAKGAGARGRVAAPPRNADSPEPGRPAPSEKASPIRSGAAPQAGRTIRARHKKNRRK